MSFCTNCGKQNDDSAKFCCECGTPLASGAQAAPAAPASAPAAETVLPGQGSVKIVDTSEPLFRAKCEYCYCVFEYHPRDLGFRAWYPHGFVYCPRCHKPLRHQLEYEVRN